MAIDIGSKRIGVAISDPLKMTARPLATLERGNIDDDIPALLKLIDEYRVSRIVAGRPLTLEGRKGPIITLVEHYVTALKKASSVKIVWADERLSTKEAEALMSELGIEVSARKKKRDEYAAALILTWYLEENPLG